MARKRQSPAEPFGTPADECGTEDERRALDDPRPLGEDFIRYLKTEVWPHAKKSGSLGKPLGRAEEDDILGYGPDGV